jgi:TonB family protein
MFSPISNPEPRSHAAAASVLLHALLLAWLLWKPQAVLVSPRFVVAGDNGAAVTQIYWSGAVDGQGSSPARSKSTSHETMQTHLTLPPRKRSAPQPSLAPQLLARADLNPEATGAASAGRRAGSSYGSVYEGAYSGSEVKPALPIAEEDPAVDLDELPGRVPGTAIVEITIDEGGHVIAKRVVQSLGSSVDAKILAALDAWRFHPATRGGVAIASKQDVYYRLPR